MVQAARVATQQRKELLAALERQQAESDHRTAAAEAAAAQRLAAVEAANSLAARAGAMRRVVGRLGHGADKAVRWLDGGSAGARWWPRGGR